MTTAATGQFLPVGLPPTRTAASFAAPTPVRAEAALLRFGDPRASHCFCRGRSSAHADGRPAVEPSRNPAFTRINSATAPASWRFSRGGHGHPWLLSVMAVLDPVRPHSLQCKRKAEPANLGVPKQSFGTFVLPFPI